MSTSELRLLAQQGVITRDTPIRNESSDWASADRVRGLFVDGQVLSSPDILASRVLHNDFIPAGEQISRTKATKSTKTIGVGVVLFIVGIGFAIAYPGFISYVAGLCVFLIATFVIYFLPALIANKREHHNGAAILVLNLFLGWTFLGWVIAFVWAFTDSDNK